MTLRRSFEKIVMGTSVLALALAVSTDLALAKMIRGEVVSLRDDGSSFSVKRPDPSNPSIMEHYDIVMRPKTEYINISSLKELAVGDEVAVDVNQKKDSKVWEAGSVRIFKLRLYHADAAQKVQPD